ncbi:uncharacterized protein LOC115921298 [Strongylocentrotus purpuratus]|uniref:DDE Tnp4 domain-containing protein n=1 Tax=Strongylocentrotus purpuratus TaxID=7668 RepID=A0A7M7NES2_STRPU|nr:uncharacterized protein LOC115921298 [Strongylocentrotus purpuratus]
MGKETIQKFVPDVARAVVDEYATEVISLPTTNEGWLEVAGDFEARWNLPHCLGGYDGKHIRLQKPNKSGSLYFNYKQFFSVVLMALVDSKYQFLWIDCFLGQMRQEPDTVRLLIEAAVMLHNLIRKHYQAWDVRMLDQEDAQHNLIPRAWRTAAITVRTSCDAALLL